MKIKKKFHVLALLPSMYQLQSLLQLFFFTFISSSAKGIKKYKAATLEAYLFRKI